MVRHSTDLPKVYRIVLSPNPLVNTRQHLWIMYLSIPAWLFFLNLQGAYDPQSQRNGRQEFALCAYAGMLGTVVLMVLMVLSKMDVSRLLLVGYLLTGTMCLWLDRAVRAAADFAAQRSADSPPGGHRQRRGGAALRRYSQHAGLSRQPLTGLHRRDGRRRSPECAIWAAWPTWRPCSTAKWWMKSCWCARRPMPSPSATRRRPVGRHSGAVPGARPHRQPGRRHRAAGGRQGRSRHDGHAADAGAAQHAAAYARAGGQRRDGSRHCRCRDAHFAVVPLFAVLRWRSS